MSLTCEVDRDRDGEVIWKKGGKKETFDLENRARINWYGRDPDWEDVLDFRGKDDVESPGLEWTRFDVFCDGGHIQTYVNGVLVNEGFDATPDYGKLQLQTELAELFVRKWELWPARQGAEAGRCGAGVTSISVFFVPFVSLWLTTKARRTCSGLRPQPM